MSIGNVHANYAEAFTAQFVGTASNLGEFASVDAAGRAAMVFASSQKEKVGNGSVFTFDGFVKGIRGIVYAGIHGYVAFIEDRDVIVSKSYANLNVWDEIPSLNNSLSSVFAHGKDIISVVIGLDIAMCNYSRGLNILKMNHKSVLHTLPFVARKVA